jgi:hypothetical protein
LSVGEYQSSHLKFTTAAVPSSSYFIVARLYQTFLRLSVPPKRVVKFVESTIQIKLLEFSVARLSEGVRPLGINALTSK